MSKTSEWICPRCFGGNLSFRFECSWCSYNPKTGHLTEKDVQANTRPCGEILWTLKPINGKIAIQFITPLRFEGDYPPHENWEPIL